MFSNKNRFFKTGLILLFLSTSLVAQTLQEKRQYEPVVVRRSLLREYFSVPVNEIFMYAYHGDSQSWELIPFQIDEVTKGPDPLNPSDSLLFYFVPDEWEISGHDGVLSNLDELVFMIRDLGDRAPEKSWISNEESKSFPRLEIVVKDTAGSENKAYGYLFRSSTINEPVPKPYNMESFPESDSLSSKYYAVDIGEYGLIEDIIIKEPWGNGKDIFDRQKLRFSGIVDLFIPVELKLTEENLFLYEEKVFTQNPVVRIVRQAKQTLQLGSDFQADTNFWVRAMFYPFSGSVEGGASISKEDLDRIYPGTVVIMDGLRQSWDFSETAAGMKFYNKNNDGILIDGSLDNVSRLIEIPVREWSLMTGAQGSFFTFTEFEETKWKDILLYYWDDKQGGQFDYDIFDREIQETGDGKSFGDHGILFLNYGQNDITLELSFTAYFIPEKNLTKNDAVHFADNLLHPINVSTLLRTDVDETENPVFPTEIKLFQNSPNPVKGMTKISFFMPGREQVKIEIRDLRGRLVHTITNQFFPAGRHQLFWNGSGMGGESVAAGIYFVVLKSKSIIKTQKLTVLK